MRNEALHYDVGFALQAVARFRHNSMSSLAPPVKDRIAHPRWGVICMLLSIAFFSINSLMLTHLARNNVSPWVALMFRAGVGMIVVATVFRAGQQVDFKRALTDRLLASRGCWVSSALWPITSPYRISERVRLRSSVTRTS